MFNHNPVKIASFLKSGDSFALSITGYTGHAYQLQRCYNLSGPWENIGPEQTGNNTPITFIDPGGASVSRRFYRVILTR